LKLTEDPHRRFNPLTGDWLLVSPHRAGRPWQGQLEKVSTQPEPEYDPTCYLCPGNARVAAYSTRATPVPSFLTTTSPPSSPRYATTASDIENRGLLDRRGRARLCRVICFSPRHNLTLATMTPKDIEGVIHTWTAQFRELGAMPYNQPRANLRESGLHDGRQQPHPHCQIWATHSVPDIPGKELVCQASYFGRHNTCLLCDYIHLEDQQKVRLVCQKRRLCCLVPFWAVWPFEVMVCSRRHLGSFSEFTEKEVGLLAELLQQVTSTYDKVFDVPFPYSMGFHQSPTDGNPHHEWHFHAHFYPPLLRSATIRKFMVGFEMLGMRNGDITPESAAAHLKSLTEKVSF
jgi:UDPglucose--hexose-1-phosphate uridylyltransferase